MPWLQEEVDLGARSLEEERGSDLGHPYCIEAISTLIWLLFVQ